MTSEPMARIRFLAAVAILGGGLTLTACSSDSSDSSDGPGDSAAVAGECKLGDTIDQPATKDGVPACASKPGGTMLTARSISSSRNALTISDAGNSLTET